jgi:1,6-anhydro-N-acetylmuramate kinase
MHMLLGELFAKAALQPCRVVDLLPSQIDVIGSHAHTTYHRWSPAGDRYWQGGAWHQLPDIRLG